MVTIQHPRLGMLRIPRCRAARGAARLVRPKITVIIRPKCKHFVLYSNSYLGVLNNYQLFKFKVLEHFFISLEIRKNPQIYYSSMF